ncbi:9968_t:CDS:1 [Cetraspora pellucida]|uniref:9968_t:CDS:1 n=1 Tax=Cetraspora pellucida TaxID=1433469 RepID=A0A9N9NP23_9GLOM|nr:9968_t:CDS:1 [Cetraspora pellucida]
MSKSTNLDKTEACLADGTPSVTDFSKIDSNMKAYIDTACQASSNTIILAIKTYIDQNNEAHKNMIAKINKCLDLCFNQIQQTHHQHTTRPQQHNESNPQDKPLTSHHNHKFSISPTQQNKEHSSINTGTQQGNCPLTPLLDNLTVSSNGLQGTSYKPSYDSSYTVPLLNGTLKIKMTT